MQQKKELTGKPTLMKEVNIGLIKEALQKQKTATRVELSAMTQISQPTVNMLMKQLLEEKEVISLGMAESTGGRKAERFALNNRRYGIASVMVSDTAIEYAVTDSELKEEAHRILGRDGSRTCLEQLCAVFEAIREEYPFVGALSVGVPGAVTPEGKVFAIPSIPDWEGFLLKEYLEKEFAVPVAVMNDINAITVGYSRSGMAPVKNIVYLQIEGSGMGAGIMIEGRLYPGWKSFAGEVGYMRLEDGARIEDMLSGGRNPESVLEKVIANLICVLNPEELILGGSVVSEKLLKKLEERCSGYLPSGVMPRFTGIISGTEYYLKGLGRQGKELLDARVRLV